MNGERIIIALFDRWDILWLSFIPAVINITILLYAAFNFPKSRSNTFFSVFVFSLFVWQLSNGFFRNSITADEAARFYRVAEVFIMFVIIFGNLFIFRFTGAYSKIPDTLIFLFLIVPPVFFIFSFFLELDKFKIYPSQNWHWIANPVPTVITILFYIWICFCSISMLVFLWLYYVKSKLHELKRKQYLLLALGFTIPIIGGIIMEVIFPLILQLNDIPITDSLVTVFSITSFIAINKYHMFDYSPKHQWNEIVESVNEGILIADSNKKIVYVNSAFCIITGYNSNEVKGRLPDDFIIYELDENNNRNNNTCINDTEYFSQLEVKIKAKNNTIIWMLMSLTPYKDRKGKVIGSILLFTNITQIKSTEQALKNTNSELELYIYKASHDLRGPLTSVLGLVNVWNTEVHDPASKQYLKMIETSAKKLEYNLTELVKAMQIKETTFFNEIIDFENLIEGLISDYKNYPGFNSMHFKLDVKLDEIVFSSNFLLGTIFQNLIENAIKYRNKTATDSFLKISIATHSDKTVITIQDNGIGIDSNSQSKVFDMYYKGQADPHGSGLGLYLVKKSIEKLKAQISIKSEEGIGTTFVIVL